MKQLATFLPTITSKWTIKDRMCRKATLTPIRRVARNQIQTIMAVFKITIIRHHSKALASLTSNNLTPLIIGRLSTSTKTSRSLHHMLLCKTSRRINSQINFRISSLLLIDKQQDNQPQWCQWAMAFKTSTLTKTKYSTICTPDHTLNLGKMQIWIMFNQYNHTISKTNSIWGHNLMTTSRMAAPSTGQIGTKTPWKGRFNNNLNPNCSSSKERSSRIPRARSRCTSSQYTLNKIIMAEMTAIILINHLVIKLEISIEMSFSRLRASLVRLRGMCPGLNSSNKRTSQTKTKSSSNWSRMAPISIWLSKKWAPKWLNSLMSFKSSRLRTKAKMNWSQTSVASSFSTTMKALSCALPSSIEKEKIS